MLTLDEKAAAVVAEMVDLGATFEIAADNARWAWAPHPELMRGAIRRYWHTVRERDEPGFASAMLVAIRRMNGGGAGVR